MSVGKGKISICEICDKIFSKVGALKIHKKTHNGVFIGDESLVCKLCNKSFTYPNYLKRHTATVHSDSRKLVPCSVCDKSFTEKGNMLKHVKQKHEEVEKHPCDI